MKETFMGCLVTRHSPPRLKPAKAQEMLENPPGGKALTGKQERFFRAVAHGWKPTRMR